ncbi:MAG: hypothetical protein L0G99_03725 [Propionibacteriales bacterium]|nr:hypothetical protein [Propionibacteriales bacterium]
MSMNIPQRQHGSIFELEFPQSVAVYESYVKAQQAVDFLSDKEFEVKNLCIVGTDLKSVERVLGRRTWKTVLTQAVLSGISTGLLVGLVLLLFFAPQTGPAVLIGALLFGIVISLIFQSIAYAVSGGRRDFTSMQQTVATKYEILSEHKVAQQARDLLATMPGVRAAAFE